MVRKKIDGENKKAKKKRRYSSHNFPEFTVLPAFCSGEVWPEFEPTRGAWFDKSEQDPPGAISGIAIVKTGFALQCLGISSWHAWNPLF